MNLSLGMKSILLFVLSIVFLGLLTLFETALVGLPITTERMISLLLLVLPGVAGGFAVSWELYEKNPKFGLLILAFYSMCCLRYSSCS